MSRYDITDRLREMGMTQMKLLEMIQTRYKESVDVSDFSKMKRGAIQGPKTERIMGYANALLTEREKKLGIENAYTKEA